MKKRVLFVGWLCLMSVLLGCTPGDNKVSVSEVWYTGSKLAKWVEGNKESGVYIYDLGENSKKLYIYVKGTSDRNLKDINAEIKDETIKINILAQDKKEPATGNQELLYKINWGGKVELLKVYLNGQETFINNVTLDSKNVS